MPFVSIGVRAGTLGVLASLVSNAVGAQQPTFTPDHADGIYRLGQRVGWTATLPKGADAPGAYHYVIRRFGADSIGSGRLSFVKGRARIETSVVEPAIAHHHVVADLHPPRIGGRCSGR